MHTIENLAIWFWVEINTWINDLDQPNINTLGQPIHKTEYLAVRAAAYLMIPIFPNYSDLSIFSNYPMQKLFI